MWTGSLRTARLRLSGSRQRQVRPVRRRPPGWCLLLRIILGICGRTMRSPRKEPIPIIPQARLREWCAPWRTWLQSRSARAVWPVLCVGSAQAGSTRGAAKVCSGTLCDPRPRCASRVTPGARRPRRLLPRVPGRRRERRQRRDIDVDVRPQVPQKMHRMLVRCKHRLPVLPRASDSAGALSPPHQDRAAQHLPERENRVNGRLAAGILATPLALPRQRTTLVR